MSFLDSIKKFFNFQKGKDDFEDIDKKETDNVELEEKANKKCEDNTEQKEQKEIQVMAKKAFEAKMNGEFDKALSLWDDFSDKFPEAKVQAKARKAKIYIILDKKKAAEKELISFFKWYSEKGSFDYNSRYFTVFISALQDLGFYVDDWPDKEKYIKNISGEDVSLDKKITMQRIESGLKYLKEKNIWSSSLEEVEKNLGMLS